MSALLTSTARVREWLEGHGDDLGLGPIGRVEIAGEVPAVRRVGRLRGQCHLPLGPPAVHGGRSRGGYPPASLAARRPATPSWRTSTASRRRDGSLSAAARSGASGRSTRSSITCGSATAWFAGPPRRRRVRRPAGRRGRADRARRRDGLDPGAGGGLAATDTGHEATDEHGETWTLAKVGPPPRLPRVRAPVGPRPPPRPRRRHRRPGRRSASTAGRTRQRWRPCCDPWAGTAGPRARRCSPRRSRARPSSRQPGTGTGSSGRRARSRMARCTRSSRPSSSIPRYQGLGVGERMMHAADRRPGRRPVRTGARRQGWSRGTGSSGSFRTAGR